MQRVDNQESQGFHQKTTLDQMAAEFPVAKQILKADWTLLSERRTPSNFWFIFICFVGSYALHEHGGHLTPEKEFFKLLFGVKITPQNITPL